MITREVLDARVQVGAAWLDQTLPGWHEAIDVHRLDLSNCARCICGQLFGGFDEAIIEYKMSPLVGMGWRETDLAVLRGFVLTDVDSLGVLPKPFRLLTYSLRDRVEKSYRILKDAWIDEIARRRFPDTVRYTLTKNGVDTSLVFQK